MPELQEEDFFKDENNNYIPDGAENYAKRTYQLLINNKLVVGLSIALLGMTYYTSYLYTNPKVVTQTVTEYVDSPEAVIKSKNFLVKNLDELEIRKVRELKSSITKGKLFGAWYGKENKDGGGIYITIIEPSDKLKYNAKAHKDYKPEESLLSK